MIKEYYLNDGTKKYLFQTYLGVDPSTGKQKRTTRRGFKTRREAQLAEARLIEEVKQSGLSTNKRYRFEEVAELWLKYYKSTVKGSTYKIRVGVLNNHVLPFFGRLFVDSIKMKQCQEYINLKSTELINYYEPYNIFVAILQYAVHLDIIKENPAKNVIRPKGIKSDYKARFYDKQQLIHFIDVVNKSDYDSNVKTCLYLLCYTGMRIGEAVSLYWSDIDFDNNKIHISRTASDTIEGFGIFEERTKTEAGMRTISIDNNTSLVLKKHQLEQKKLLFMYGKTVSKENQLVFSDRNNQIMYRTWPHYYLSKIIEDNDLPPMNLHGLRHTHISLLFESGATIKEVQDRVGHEDYRTTMNIYTHVTAKAKDEAANKFLDYMSK